MSDACLVAISKHRDSCPVAISKHRDGDTERLCTELGRYWDGRIRAEYTSCCDLGLVAEKFGIYYQTAAAVVADGGARLTAARKKRRKRKWK